MPQTIAVEEPTLVLLKTLQQIPIFHDLDLFGTITANHEEIIESLEDAWLEVSSEHTSNRVHIFRINGMRIHISI